MNAPQANMRSLTGKLVLVLLVALGSVALIGSTGCDELGGYGTDWGYGYDYYDYGYGPIDDDVFQGACDAWDDYIRM